MVNQPKPARISYDAPFGKSEQVVSTLSLITILIVAFLFQVGKTEGVIRSAIPAWTSFILIFGVGLLWLTAPRNYRLRGNHIQIWGLLLRKSIEYKNIQRVEIFREGELELKSPSFLSDSFFPHARRWNSDAHGKITMCANRRFPSIIICCENKTYLLSCDNPAEFTAALRKRIDVRA